jgi:hypothetical protein
MLGARATDKAPQRGDALPLSGRAPRASQAASLAGRWGTPSLTFPLSSPGTIQPVLLVRKLAFAVAGHCRCTSTIRGQFPHCATPQSRENAGVKRPFALCIVRAMLSRIDSDPIQLTGKLSHVCFRGVARNAMRPSGSDNGHYVAHGLALLHEIRTSCGVRAERCRKKPSDTVGEFKSAEMGVPHMPAWKAKTLGKLAQEKVLLEPRRRFANSIPSFSLDKSGPRSWHRPPHLPLCQAHATQHRRKGTLEDSPIMLRGQKWPPPGALPCRASPRNDHVCTRTHANLFIPSPSVANVRYMLESCDNRARREKTMGKCSLVMLSGHKWPTR